MPLSLKWLVSFGLRSIYSQQKSSGRSHRIEEDWVDLPEIELRSHVTTWLHKSTHEETYISLGPFVTEPFFFLVILSMKHILCISYKMWHKTKARVALHWPLKSIIRMRVDLLSIVITLFSCSTDSTNKHVKLAKMRRTVAGVLGEGERGSHTTVVSPAEWRVSWQAQGSCWFQLVGDMTCPSNLLKVEVA